MSGNKNRNCVHSTLSTLVLRAGVPEALRGEVWQRLSMASEKMELTIENYRELVTKESPDEKVIFRDIHRTFPAHEFFKVYKDPTCHHDVKVS